MLNRVLRAVTVRAAQRLPLAMFEKTLLFLVQTRAQSLPADEALRLLFRMDNALYSWQGTYAVKYGDGTHTKHRHMNYHDFFVARVHAGEHVLDIGCGIGAVAHEVAARSDAQVTGIDISESNIAYARSHYAHPKVTYLVGDVLKGLPQTSAPVDVVILSNVLEHLPGRPQFLRQVQTVVNPSRMLIRVPLFERDWRVPLKKELGVEWRLDDTHEIEYTIETFHAEMAEAGLTVRHLEVHWGEIWSEVAVQPR